MNKLLYTDFIYASGNIISSADDNIQWNNKMNMVQVIGNVSIKIKHILK